MNWNDVKKWVNSKEGNAVIAFLIGKNSKQLGAWIQKLGKTIAKEGTFSKAAMTTLGKAGLKIAGLIAAVYIAKEDVRKSFTKVGKIWNDDSLNVIEKVGKTWVETWPPVMFINDIKDFWNWATKKNKPKDANLEIAVNKLDAILTPEERKASFNKQANPQESKKPERYSNIEDIAKRTGYSVEALKRMPTDEINRILKQRGGNSMGNDPKWYKQGKLNGIEYSGEYNFDMKNGDETRSPLPKFDGTSLISCKAGLPSVASMSLVLTIGHTYNDLLENMFDDVTIKIKALNKNSALTTSWTKKDLLLLIHTMRVAYALWCIGKNCYKLVNEYSGSDLTLPYAYFAAMGFDLDAWQSVRSQIQEDLIFISGKMDTYIDFSKLDLFKRTEQLFTSGYADSHSRKAQKILFALDPETSYYNFKTASVVKLSTHSVPAFGVSANVTGATYAQWKAAMIAILDSLVNAQVVQDMLSCLRFVYGTGKTNMFEIPKPSDRLEFKWNSEVMSQIENSYMYAVNSYTLSAAANMTWPTETFGGVVTGFGAITGMTKHYYNSHQGKVSKDDQIVSTRLTCAYLTIPDSTNKDFYFGTEVPTRFRIIMACTNLYTGTHLKNLELFEYAHGKILHFGPASTGTADLRNVAKDAIALAAISTFDWAPIIECTVQFALSSSTATQYTFSGTFSADWEDYAIMFDTSVDASLIWMSYMRNGNYSLYSEMSTKLDEILDAAKTA